MINLTSILLESHLKRHGSRLASEGMAYNILFCKLQFEIG